MINLRKSLTFFTLCALLMFSGVTQAAELPDFTNLAEKAGAAVVNIGTEKTSSPQSNKGFNEFFRNVPPGFEKFFEQFDQFHGNQPQRKQRSLGSGFIVSEDGYIVTNYHVVKEADIINVNLQGATGKSDAIVATLVGSDEETDIALLKVDVKEKLPFLTFADSEKAKVGQWVLAIGNPFGLEHTVTAGILSAKGRDINAGPFDNFLQTDASINPGNSGGPLLNMNGEVVGINTAIIASGQGIGFAIPSSMAAQITEQLKSGKKVSRGWIGVTIQDVDENVAKALGLEKEKGALIGSVMPGEPADKGGIKAGDVIISVNGKDVADSDGLLRAIAEQKPGSKTKIVVLRDGKQKELTVTLGERTQDQLNAQRGGPQTPGKKQETVSLGISARPVTVDEARQLEMNKAQGLLIVDIEQDGSAAEAGLRAGDVILAANMLPVNTSKELAKIISEVSKRGAVMLQIYRRGDTFLRAVSLGQNNKKEKK